MFDDASQDAGFDGEHSAKTSLDYLKKAADARMAGDATVALYLYLAAFDLAAEESDVPSEDCIRGMKVAWTLACEAKQRSLAEYVFERLEPYLSTREVDAYAQTLQQLAIDKLEEFGVSPEDIEDMIESLPAELMGLQGGVDFRVDGPAPLMPPFLGAMPGFQPGFEPGPPPPLKKDEEAVDASDELPAMPTDAPAVPAASSGKAGRMAHPPVKNQASGVGPVQTPAGASVPPNVNLPLVPPTPFGKGNQALPAAPGGSGMVAPGVTSFAMPAPEKIAYADLAGYERTVLRMQDFGIGLGNDPDFQKFVSLLNARHGLSGMPVADTLVFTCPAREDAQHFMEATFGELDLPGVRMRLEENMQGAAVLCVLAQTAGGLKLNASRNEIEGTGILVLDDIDTWGQLVPLAQECENAPSPMARGAQNALHLIRSAVENPEVYVLASCSSLNEVDGFFLDLLGPFTEVPIDLPNESERSALWALISREHPSISYRNVNKLAEYTAGMPRFDIYMAAQEAIDATYKASLVSRTYRPVSLSTLFEKIANYQPLDSPEYRALEEAVVEDFRAELMELDNVSALSAPAKPSGEAGTLPAISETPQDEGDDLGTE